MRRGCSNSKQLKQEGQRLLFLQKPPWNPLWPLAVDVHPSNSETEVLIPFDVLNFAVAVNSPKQTIAALWPVW